MLGHVEAVAHDAAALPRRAGRARQRGQQERAQLAGRAAFHQQLLQPGAGRGLAGQAQRDQLPALHPCALVDAAVRVAVAQGFRPIEAGEGVELGQPGVRNRAVVGGAQHHGGFVAAGQPQGGVGEARQPRHQALGQLGGGLAGALPPQQQQRVGQVGAAHGDRAVLELGLLRVGVEGGAGQRVDAGRVQRVAPPVHCHEGLAAADLVGGVGAQHDLAAAAADLHQLAVGNAEPGQLARVQVDARLADVGVEARQLAGAAHAVPLVAQPAGGEVQRIVRVGRFGGGGAHRHHETGAPVVGGEAAVGIQPGPRRRVAGGAAGGEGPLLRPGLLQQGVAEAADVHVATHGARRMLGEDGRAVGVVEQPRGLGPAQPRRQRPGQVADDAPVGAGLAGRRHGAVHAADAALRVGDAAVLLAPGGGRQQQVGVGGGLGAAVGVLQHHEVAARQRRVHRGQLGHRLGRVGAGDPQGLDLAGARRAEQLHRAEAGLGRYVGHPPEARDFGAVSGVGELPVGRQQVGEGADLAPAHRVGLAGQRERAAARPADLPGGQRQGDQRGAVVGAVGGLVEALAPQGHRRAGGAPPARRGDDVGRGEAAHLGGAGRRGVPHVFAQGLEALGVGGDEGGVEVALGDQHVQHRVEQPDVGAGAQREVQVGARRGVGAARVDDDHLHARTGLPGPLDAPEGHRVGVGRVAAGDQQAVGVVEILVGAGRGVGTQGLLVGGDGAGHAQPRVAVDVVAADQRLHGLVEDVVVLGEQLAGDVEGHRVGAVAAYRVGEAVGGVGDRLVPADAPARLGAGAAQLGVEQAGLGARGEVERRALGAQPAEVGRMRRVAAHAGDLPAVVFDQHAAADAAVGAGGFRFEGGGHGACPG